MNKPEIFIEISPKGEVKAEIRGAKGKACMQYAQLLQEIVGTMSSVEHTSEYYEPDEQVSLYGEQNLYLDQSR